MAGVAVYDDYGHHPTAIRATLGAVRQREPGRRIWAVYEPLTYHRTAALFDEIRGASFDVPQRLGRAVRPADFQAVDLSGAAQAEGQRLFGRGEVGLPARDLLRHILAPDRRGDAGADGVAIGLAGPHEAKPDAVPGPVEAVDEDASGTAVLD